MSRTRKIRRRIGPKPAWLPALTAAALGLAPLAARAASYTYGSQQRTVNAGVLVVGTASSPVQSNPPAVTDTPDPAPYVFETLNLRADVKPFGWNIINPRAPSGVSGATQTRWPAYSLGQSVTPTMAAYWEVPLRDTAADQLRQYDVLYLDATAPTFSAPGVVAKPGVTLTPADNAKLRRFVDGGGQLWVEYRGSGGTGLNALFTGTQWTGGTAGTVGAYTLPTDGMGILRTPLVSQPFLFSAQDFSNFGAPGGAGSLAGLSGESANLLGDVFYRNGVTAAQAGQYGAGQIIADAVGIGGTLSPSGPYYAALGTLPMPQIAPTPDLKFLANLISYSETHPGENKNSHGDTANNDVASFAPAWTVLTPPPLGTPPPPAGTPPPAGAAVWGNYVFVTDSLGVVRAYDAYPAEDLTGGGKPDDGTPDFGGIPGNPPTPPTEYDQIWQAQAAGSAAFASAPTVAVYGGQTHVLVEDRAGVVSSFDVGTGGTGAALPGSGAAPPYPVGSYVPAPTCYEGRVYAAQPDGTLYVYDSNSGASAGKGVKVPLQLATSNEVGVAPPSVGLLADGAVTSDAIALVPTNVNLSAVFLGARADLLQPVSGATPPSGYSVNRQHLGFLPIQIDKNAVPGPQAYTLDGLGSSTYTGNGPSSGGTSTSADFTAGTTTGTYYGDYDQDLTVFTPGGAHAGETAYLSQISGSSFGAVQGGSPLTKCVFSAAAFDRRGDFYYTETDGDGSYLVGVHGDPQFRNVRLKFRFRMPKASDPPLNDPDGIAWNTLTDYQFVGAPVIDAQGHVFVAASSGTKAAVLCFDANGEIYADAPAGFDPTQATLFQADESSLATAPNQLRPGGEISGNPNTPLLRYGEYTASGSRVTFFNFGVGTGSQRQLAGNLSEPQAVTATPNVDANNPTQTSTPVTLNLHTNLLWYAVLPSAVQSKPFVQGQTSGLSKAGNTLFLIDSGASATMPNRLFSLSATPSLSAGKTATPMDPAGNFDVSQIVPLTLPKYIGTVAAAPSIGGSVMTITGTLGTATLTQQLTLIADNNRILETDTQGNAVWATDSTTAASGTKTDFSHPTALAQVAPNDYLVADTGNNRCVRFDRAGDVIWELTTFSDPNKLLAVGQPLTLSQPSSVQIRFAKDSSGNPVPFYLIADSGNNRVLEVQDHTLTWVSHTADQNGRAYRYGSATYYGAGGGTPTYIAAAVTNTRIAPLAAGGALSPASGDAPGGSIVLFDYSKSVIFGVYTSFQTQTGTAASPTTTLVSVLNPRFLSVFAPASGAVPSLLYADDNGAFDLSYDSTKNVFFAAPGALNFPAGKGTETTNTTYQAMTLPAVGITGNIVGTTAGTYNRVGLPFVPTSIQRLDSGSTNPRYLITQGHSQAELGTNASRIGGEVFEVDGHTDPNDPKFGPNIAVGGFGGATLSRPGLTGPLTQPTSAIRPQ